MFDTVHALTGGGSGWRTDLVAHRIYAEAFGAAAYRARRGDGHGAVRHPCRVTVQHVYFRKRSAMTSRNAPIYAGLLTAAVLTVAPFGLGR